MSDEAAEAVGGGSVLGFLMILALVAGVFMLALRLLDGGQDD